MLEVGPRIRHFCVQLRNTALVLARALSFGKLRRPLTIAVIAPYLLGLKYEYFGL